MKWLWWISRNQWYLLFSSTDQWPNSWFGFFYFYLSVGRGLHFFSLIFIIFDFWYAVVLGVIFYWQFTTSFSFGCLHNTLLIDFLLALVIVMVGDFFLFEEIFSILKGSEVFMITFDKMEFRDFFHFYLFFRFTPLIYIKKIYMFINRIKMYKMLSFFCSFLYTKSIICLIAYFQHQLSHFRCVLFVDILLKQIQII